MYIYMLYISTHAHMHPLKPACKQYVLCRLCMHVIHRLAYLILLYIRVRILPCRCQHPPIK